MIIELEADDVITITTPNGIIVVSVADDGSFTQCLAAYGEGHKLRFQPYQNAQTGQQDAQVWIEPAGGL